MPLDFTTVTGQGARMLPSQVLNKPQSVHGDMDSGVTSQNNRIVNRGTYSILPFFVLHNNGRASEGLF